MPRLRILLLATEAATTEDIPRDLRGTGAWTRP